ncbi:MAG: hypothetical protein DMD91_24725 [Candidatus Rokuibacteriota bacterium]|nr:MAG: hypothetical protein DMD91_24725 [Candidatus Rokubacteria bacterium]
MSEYSGVWSALSSTCRRILAKSVVTSAMPRLSASASRNAFANTECVPPPTSETGSWPPEVMTVRARLRDRVSASALASPWTPMLRVSVPE